MLDIPVNRWIRRIAPNQSFVDIGGIGEYSVNERVSVSLGAGASRVAMADIVDYSSPYWSFFFDLMQQRGITRDQYETFENIDITQTNLSQQLPTFHIVHSTGILYHVPDPATSLYNLVQISSRWLIINTVIAPQVILNARGSIGLPTGSALFLPGLSEDERNVLQVHYQKKFGWDINVNAPRPECRDAMMPYLNDEGRLSCWPYWWLFTVPAFRALARLMHLRIHEEWTWEDHAHFMLVEKE